MERIDDYRVIRELGRGGFGYVVEALDPQERRVAVKVLHPALVEDPKVVQRFFQEALILAKLQHPAIPQIFHFGPWEGTYYLVQEFVEGKPISEHLALRPLGTERAVSVLGQLFGALAYAHAREVVHRDLKPQNLIETPEGRIMILDFGIAKILGGVPLTAPGTVNVTLAYASPEQLLGHPNDARADLFAAGILIHELLTGRVPFRSRARDPISCYKEHLHWIQSARQPLRAAAPHAPAWLDEIYQRCTAEAPEDRYQSADEVRDALKAGIQGKKLPPRRQKTGALLGAPEASSHHVKTSELDPSELPNLKPQGEALQISPTPSTEDEPTQALPTLQERRPAPPPPQSLKPSTRSPAPKKPEPRPSLGPSLVLLSALILGVVALSVLGVFLLQG